MPWNKVDWVRRTQGDLLLDLIHQPLLVPTGRDLTNVWRVRGLEFHLESES